MSNKKYSLNQLNNIATSIDNLLTRSREDTVHYSRYLVYGLSKNLRVIEEEIQHLNEQLEEPDEKYIEYQQKVFTLAKDCGGKLEESPQGGQMVNMQVEDFDSDRFGTEKKELDEEYKKTIEKQTEINKKNEALKRDSISEPTWHPLDLEHFPEELGIDDMPYGIIDLIEVK